MAEVLTVLWNGTKQYDGRYLSLSLEDQPTRPAPKLAAPATVRTYRRGAGAVVLEALEAKAMTLVELAEATCLTVRQANAAVWDLIRVGAVEQCGKKTGTWASRKVTKWQYRAVALVAPDPAPVELEADDIP